MDTDPGRVKTKAIPPPFPWFGGKSKVAGQIWQLLGNVQNYVEPFFGSGAVLFARPHRPKTETVNDLDHWIANFWRAVQHEPDEVARWADNPVNEDDLSARHIWLVKYGLPELAERIPADPGYFNAKIAGWWVWGICCWIGSGWCSGKGPWTEVDGQLIHLGNAGQGVNRQLIHLGDAGRGVNRQLIHLGTAGQGVNRQLIHLGDAGRGDGAHKKRPHLTNDGRGVNAPSRGELVGYFQLMADRLKNVRVCSGDWSRTLTNGALSYGDTIGVFLDPPYSHDGRNTTLYNNDSATVSGDVLRWCIENGHNPRYRIALCGYEGEHDELGRHGWKAIAWKANRAYGQAGTDTRNNANRTKERIWYNSNCLRQPGLFDSASEGVEENYYSE